MFEGVVEKHEDNCRLPWMMVSHDERRLVTGVFPLFLKILNTKLLMFCKDLKGNVCGT